MRATPNTGAGKVAGDVFPSATANDLLKIAVGADDDSLAELLDIEPPAGVTVTTPRVGFLPLRNGPVVVGDAVARNVNVGPIRAFRSSIDSAKPREMLSALSTVTTTVAMPAVVTGAGNWRLELLYAQLTYVDATKPEKGTSIAFYFAPTAAGSTPAPSVAVLPPNTSSPPTWNVPLVYVKNVTGQTAIASEDIIEVPPAVVGGFAQDYQARFVAKKTGIDARRAYSSNTHSPLRMVSGGASPLATGASMLTSLITPPLVGRHNVEMVVRHCSFPKEITGFTNNVLTHVEWDDTRDWRGGDFVSFWCLSSASGTFFGEDDTGNGAANTRVMPGLSSGALSALMNAMHMSWGQTWNPEPLTTIGNGATDLIAAEVQTDTLLNNGTNYWAAAGTKNMGLTVDPATGVLRFSRKISGTALAGAAVSCVLLGFFPNHR